MSSQPAPPPKRPGRRPSITVVRAAYDFTPNGPNQLQVKEGEILYVIDKTHQDWWTCRRGGEDSKETGLVPATYLKEADEISNPLHEAVKRGNVDWAKELLTNGLSVNSLDQAGNTPLHWAARSGHVPCVLALLYEPGVGGSMQLRNIVLDKENALGDTPLHGAAWKGSIECVRLLLDAARQKGVSLVLSKNREGRLPEDLATNVETQALIKQARISLQAKPIVDNDYDSDEA